MAANPKHEPDKLSQPKKRPFCLVGRDRRACHTALIHVAVVSTSVSGSRAPRGCLQAISDRLRIRRSQIWADATTGETRFKSEQM